MYLSTTRTLRFKKLPRFRFSLSLSLSLTLVFFLLLPFFSFFFIFFSFCVIVPCKIRYSRIVDMYIHVSRVRFLSIVVLSFFFSREIFFFSQLRHDSGERVLHSKRIAIGIRCVLNPQSRMKRLLRILIPTRLWDT